MENRNCTPEAAINFYMEVVEPTVTSFLNKPNDKRLACLACLCLSALAEHYIHATTEREAAASALKAFRISSRNENWAIGQVNDIANATKHVIRRGSGLGYQDINTEEIIVGNLQCGWPINGEEVMVETSPDKLWLVTDLVETTNEWWRTKLGLVDRDRN